MYNILPSLDTRLSPIELLTGTMFHDYNHFSRVHVFKCPVYVFDTRIKIIKSSPSGNAEAVAAFTLELADITTPLST